MSIVLITQHDENIYNLAKAKAKPKPEKTEEREVASPSHQTSKFDHHQHQRVKKEHKSKTVEEKKYATMGPAEYPPPDTKNFLKKRTWKPPMKTPSQLGKYQPCGRNVPIPRTSDAIKEYEERMKQISKRRNFIAENVKYVLKLKPKEPEKKLVIDCHGESKNINRGLQPQYLYSASFGKTPKYLKRFMQSRERVMQLKKDITVTESNKPKCRYITKEERDELLNVGSWVNFFVGSVY